MCQNGADACDFNQNCVCTNFCYVGPTCGNVRDCIGGTCNPGSQQCECDACHSLDEAGLCSIVKDCGLGGSCQPDGTCVCDDPCYSLNIETQKCDVLKDCGVNGVCDSSE